MPPEHDTPTMVLVHGAGSRCGIGSWVRRMMGCEPSAMRCEWRVVVAGSASQVGGFGGVPGVEADAVSLVSWPDDAPAIAQVNTLRDALRADADGVAAVDSPHAYVAAAAEALPLLGVIAADDASARYLVEHWGALVDDWMRVSEGACGGLGNLIASCRRTRPSRAEAERRWRALLAAMSSIGSAGTAELEGLAIDFLRARGLSCGDFRFTARFSIDPTDFPLVLPDLPNPETALVLEALERAADLGAGRVAIFPAGDHAQRLTHHAADHPALACFVDERAEDVEALPLHILSRPILTPANARIARVDAVIVVSPSRHEPALATRAAQLFPGIPIFTLHAADGERNTTGITRDPPRVAHG